MNFSFILIFVFAFVITSEGYAATPLTRSAALEDIAEAFAIIKEVHPDPYTIMAKDRVDFLRSQMESRLADPLERRDLFLNLAPIIASLQDGHTSLRLPSSDFREEVGNAAFPVDIQFDVEKLVVSQDFSGSQIPVGTEIVAINGYDVKKMVDRLLPFQHAELHIARRMNIVRFFRQYLWCVFQMRSPYELTLAESHHGKKKLTLAGLPIDDMNERRAANDRPFQPYSYRQLSDSRVGLLEYNVCEPSLTFDQFLRKTFEQIQRDNIKALIIDVRRNGGGSARANIALFDYVTGKRYRMYRGGAIKISDRIKNKLGRDRFESRFAAWNTPSGTIMSEMDRDEFWYQPGENRFRFRGPVYVLAGPNTQSSGMNFVCAVKDCRLGTVVGEETGDPATAFGDLEPFRLRNSGLELYVSTKFFIRPNGDEERRGVLPDIAVESSAGDSTQDAAIVAALAHWSARSATQTAP